MTISRLDILIERFRNKTISDAEHAELLQLLAQPEHKIAARKFFKDVMDGQSGEEQLFSATESETLYASIQASIDAKERKPVVRVLPVWKWAGIAAAACILIIAGYWLLKPPGEKIVTGVAKTSTTASADLPPGNKNKAILILGDNKQIELDSTAAGVLSLQGATTVRKDANGQIVYDNGAAQYDKLAIVYNTLEIPKGGEYELVLSDGSKVWLNSASRLRFPVNFTGDTREVELSGEAYFEIAKDAARPFKVHFTTSTVEVLGTHFNVNAYEDESRQAVTLLEGSVKVGSTQEMVKIKPGQQAVLGGINKINVKEVATEEVVAWKNGYFMFADEDIRTIMRRLARWYNFTPEYQGDIDNEQFGGMVSKYRNISEVLKMFESTGTIHFKIIPGDNSGKGKKIIITR